MIEGAPWIIEERGDFLRCVFCDGVVGLLAETNFVFFGRLWMRHKLLVIGNNLRDINRR